MDMIRTTEALTFQDFLRYPALRVEEGEFAFVTGRSGAGKSTYLLLLVVLVVMRVCRIDQTRLLVVSSMKMTVQLILAGLILTCKNAKGCATKLTFCDTSFLTTFVSLWPGQ